MSNLKLANYYVKNSLNFPKYCIVVVFFINLMFYYYLLPYFYNSTNSHMYIMFNFTDVNNYRFDFDITFKRIITKRNVVL